MTFTESIKTCFSKYVTFAGRASRSEFWYFMLFCLLGNTILSLFDGFVLGMSSIQPASSVFSLVTFLPSICETTRRLHDGNRRGWWQLIWLAPIPVFIAAYVLNARSLMVVGGIAMIACVVMLLGWLIAKGSA
jgi:uncharacterized membrane protein YhaH (DUF805 family)